VVRFDGRRYLNRKRIEVIQERRVNLVLDVGGTSLSTQPACGRMATRVASSPSSRSRGPSRSSSHVRQMTGNGSACSLRSEAGRVRQSSTSRETCGAARC
jgi:hypothetical protein